MRVLALVILSLALFGGTAATALGAPPERCVSGREYGEHISMHAKMGHFGPEMNPGMHQGFAGFCEHHDHGDM